MDGNSVKQPENKVINPLYGLTSLAKAEHEKVAKECGFDDFEEKLDHDRLKQKVCLLAQRKRNSEVARCSTNSQTLLHVSLGWTVVCRSGTRRQRDYHRDASDQHPSCTRGR